MFSEAECVGECLRSDRRVGVLQAAEPREQVDGFAAGQLVEYRIELWTVTWKQNSLFIYLQTTNCLAND